MSKIGRKPIDTNGVQVELKGQDIHLKGKKGSLHHQLPPVLKAQLEDNKLAIKCDVITAQNKADWGLHRALVANKIKGLNEGFEKKIVITGLGFKATLAGNKLVFTLGYSHKEELVIPQGITVEVDKSGQQLVVKGIDKALVGFFADKIADLREPEPYKGTGILPEGRVLLRKAGKTKSS